MHPPPATIAVARVNGKHHQIKRVPIRSPHAALRAALYALGRAIPGGYPRDDRFYAWKNIGRQDPIGPTPGNDLRALLVSAACAGAPKASVLAVLDVIRAEAEACYPDEDQTPTLELHRALVDSDNRVDRSQLDCAVMPCRTARERLVSHLAEHIAIASRMRARMERELAAGCEAPRAAGDFIRPLGVPR